MPVEALYWKDGRLYVLDQTRLPEETVYVTCSSYRDAAEAIKTMRVRGAPAIGAVGAFGLVLGALETGGDRESFLARLREIAGVLRDTRPTAVNLDWALERMLARAVETLGEPGALRAALLAEAQAIVREDIEANRRMGLFGRELIPDPARILTHCNAGALATAGYGTALGVIRAAREAGKQVKVFAGETRPFLQGARLTAWELMREGIEVVLVADNMAGYLMAREGLDLVIVGADRVAANGDVANKIGTYSLAVLARAHGIPFYVAVPLSTVDLRTAIGRDIPIEERDPAELTHFRGRRVAPQGVAVWNPAFDVTPNELITALITDAGVLKPPFGEALRRAVGSGRRE
ncbi:S-methyl-5-thioribose-1-phosphate isomerase [Candidatus Desulforudis audaxviator]|uniref:Methylthioribose-1-phosphate isomerase n=1 Tax=Desulforudis audaxviator (strain MP104C) TaxID=477974 RepID=MTNA_DESAP|nr:S-methyl-5-thioribose-1-phosphate isomerase [Candidatus Desulforudis audaxviator]B1I2P1.1 RecName: Full=Methylthioribose-1-phosphate isomerase; Short=M1Pi; Short=MTR-1-P isomerase; AltName: Full=S-methyl-5-thioribose-1-phosphate isomerase [Candidatus Desulforudis audaxviator MP104C]ACA59182.1 putative translation initiation factor, aIF-2BI family [Candidatus Desulforudis audaxviator MP104C]AZK59252.1 Methylthioribose-1-phosphate isomerase [Candidatus Desulforudis audaxviator]